MRAESGMTVFPFIWEDGAIGARAAPILPVAAADADAFAGPLSRIVEVMEFMPPLPPPIEGGTTMPAFEEPQSPVSAAWAQIIDLRVVSKCVDEFGGISVSELEIP